MDNEIRDALFEGVVNALGQKELQKLITPEQKQAVLNALDASCEVIDDDHIRMSFLCMVIEVDATDSSNPKLGLSFDMNALQKLVAK